MNNDAHIRWMIRRDIPAVLAIEHEAFDDPWDEEQLIACLRQRNCIGMVAEIDDEVVGYMIYELHRDRLHVLNFAVCRGLQRYGIGRKMIDKLKDKLRPEHRTHITLETSETNDDGHQFFAAMGFEATLAPEFYGTWHDAYSFRFPPLGELETQWRERKRINNRLFG